VKLVLFGATGNVGQRIVREALGRGHQITGVVRGAAQLSSPDPRVILVEGDATDTSSVARVAQGADAIVSAISPRPSTQGAAPSLPSVARALIAGARQAGVKRLVVVGGAGSLEVAPGRALVDTPDFPEAWKPEALQHREALQVLRNEAGDLDWTFISPAAEIGPGERTARYRTGGDQLLTDDQGESHISFEDYAVALLDELERGAHLRQRMGVAY
jgi:uncharacterized protein